MGILKIWILNATLLLCSSCLQNQEQAHSPIDTFDLIAHAAGGISGHDYSNSLTALSHNKAKGYRYFEIDFNLTSDGQLVIFHDWERNFVKFLNGEKDKIPTHEQFLKMNWNYNLEKLTFPILTDWLMKNPDAFIITDIKAGANLKYLELIRIKLKKVIHQVIPQVYNFSEAQSAHKMGYNKIILTLYRHPELIADIENWNFHKQLFALTLPYDMAMKSESIKKLAAKGLRIYVHTVNSENRAMAAQDAGFSGVYTDFLNPSHFKFTGR